MSTAVSLSASLDDVVVSGVEVLRIAFRLGVHVSDVSKDLETNDTETLDSWAYVVYGLTAGEAQKELDIIHTRDVSWKPKPLLAIPDPLYRVLRLLAESLLAPSARRQLP